jgi:2-desacetyl-2-hydroxyethyl bacteriochlorophyllide A dehydrogenase
VHALIWTEDGIAFDEMPDISPAPGEVVIGVRAIGICGSDVSTYRGELVRPAGRVPGHELSGTVSEVGDGVEAALIGRRVTVCPVLSCGECWACRSGADNLCPRLRLIGVHATGGFAERIVVPARNAVLVPDIMPFERAAAAEPFAQAIHDVRLAKEAVPDARAALVIGAGSVGLLLVNAARLAGIGEIDVVEPMAERHALALAAGARRVVGSAAELDPSVFERAGYDAVFDVVGIPQTRRQAVDLARKGGVILMVGLHVDEAEISWRTMIRKELTLRGANALSSADFATAVRWLEEKDVVMGSDPVFLPLEEGPAAFADIAAGRNRAPKTYLVVDVVDRSDSV